MRLTGPSQQRRKGEKRGHLAWWGYDRDLRFLGSRRGRLPEKDLAWRGIGWGPGPGDGTLARLLNVPPLGPQRIAAYKRDGWPGLQISLAHRALGTVDSRILNVLDPLDNRKLPASVLREGIDAFREKADDLLDSIYALLEAAMFARAKWTIARCEHARPHPVRRAGRSVPQLLQGPHSYVRPIRRGPPPAACFLAREARKKSEQRKDPEFRRRERETARRRRRRKRLPAKTPTRR